MSRGLGIPEEGLFVNDGIPPRAPDREGVPLMVPVVDILVGFCSDVDVRVQTRINYRTRRKNNVCQ